MLYHFICSTEYYSLIFSINDEANASELVQTVSSLLIIECRTDCVEFVFKNETFLFLNSQWMNEWMNDRLSLFTYERAGKELLGSVMLITGFTRLTPWMYAYV